MQEASVSIRLNPFKGCAGPEGILVPWSPYGRILESRPSFTLDPLFHAGCYYVQDSSAMFVGKVFRDCLSRVLAENGGEPVCVLDLCAAPGGKTTDLAASLREALGERFILVSNEVMKARSQVLLDNVALWGDPNVVVTSVDPAAFKSLQGYFDIIVADVPCSGEGMFRKDPKAREQFSQAVVELCAARQKRILADVWPALRAGGYLVYSTCTYQDAENDANLLWACTELGGEALPADGSFASHGVETTRAGNLLRVGKVPGEGQWAGALRKDGSSVASLRTISQLEILRPLRSGIRKGEMKGRDFVPDSDYALSLDFDRTEYNCVEADLQTALHFLHRDALRLPEAPPGYNVICYQGHPLGFVKNIGNRCNNLLPKSRRILMNI